MPAAIAEFRDALQCRPLLLDGATGTELERRGVACALPLWSAGALLERPDVVAAIHRDYVAAGADIIVANTFRTNPRTLTGAGRLAEGARLNRQAIELVRNAVARQGAAAAEPTAGARDTVAARADRRVWIAASVAPVEDCYRPERVPCEDVLRDEHAQITAWLKSAAPDLIWIETMNTIREARAAAEAAAEAGLPFTVSFVVQEDGDLLGGDSLEAAVAAVELFDPLAIGINCIPPRAVAGFLKRLRRGTDRPLLAYAHINNASPIRGWSYAQALSPAEYADCARRWLDEGASIIGGCCGTTPEHVRALAELLDQPR